MIEVVQSFEGEFFPICDAWSDTFSGLVDRLVMDTVVTFSSISLQERPIPQTIIVYSDGVALTVGWSYNETENRIDFDSNAIPAAETQLDIVYDIALECPS